MSRIWNDVYKWLFVVECSFWLMLSYFISCILNHIFNFISPLLYIFWDATPLSLSQLSNLPPIQPPKLCELLGEFNYVNFYTSFVEEGILPSCYPVLTEIHINFGSNLFLFRHVEWCCEIVPQVNGFLLLVHHLSTAERSTCIRLNPLRNTSARSEAKCCKKKKKPHRI